MVNTEFVFLFYYCVEVMLAVFNLGREGFFKADGWEWRLFDLVIVIAGIFQAALHALASSSGMVKAIVRRSRILRVLKVLRVIRAVNFLPELRQMAEAVVGAGFPKSGKRSKEILKLQGFV